MSFTKVLRRHAIAPAATAITAGIILYPRTTLHAETAEEPLTKKPIYDDDYIISTSSTSTPSASFTQTPVTASRPKPTSPTPTDRLAKEVGRTRMFLYAHVAAAEGRVNSLMDSFLHLENSFTSTIASLAPPRESGEQLLPGTLYVLVAAMTGSIVARNRNIVLRGAVPLAVGIGAGWIVLPITMHNISELLWRYEEKFPAIADSHLRTRESIRRAWEMTRVHTQAAMSTVDQKVGESREAVEGWVRKGK